MWEEALSLKTYREVSEAMDAAHEWMLMLSNENEIFPATIEDLNARGELRTWFERQMGDSGP